jgi:hypothetical protein
MMKWKDFPITDGTAQTDRQQTALVPGYFNVDELSFENLLAMGAEFASKLKFYNLNNEVEGDWGDLFSADEAVIMASILSINLERIESDFQRLSLSAPEELPSFIVDLANKIDFWFVRLSASENSAAELLAYKLATMISEKLAVELHKLYMLDQQTELSPKGIDYSGFAALWGLSEQHINTPLAESQMDEQQHTEYSKQHLSGSFYVFSNSISHLQKETKLLLQDSLDSGQHDPSIGLFMVFLKLYEKAQLKLNTFTQRHLEFYYQQVLNVANRSQLPESYYLFFEIQTGKHKTLIDKNTEFSSGKDAHLKEILYCSDAPLLVTDARVESVATLYLQHEESISPEFELDLVTRMKSDLRQISSTNSAAEPDTAKDKVASWSLFGAEHPSGIEGTSVEANIGFSIASASFLLAQGVRKINIQIELEPAASINIDTQVCELLRASSEQVFRQRFGILFARYLLSFKGCLTELQTTEILHRADSLLTKTSSQEIASLLTQDWQGLFYKMFKKTFCIKLTTKKGWLDVHDYILLPYSEDPESHQTGLQIVLTLGQDVEPITAYKTAVHGGELETELPVMQCLINPQTNFYPYSILQSLAIASVQIDIDVKGVKNLQAFNHHGQLDSSKPFQPFGPLPSINSYFIFGHYELARKELQELKIHFDWSKLPRDTGGFGEFYHAYETPFANNAFKTTFSTLKDGHWMPDDASSADSFKLFETEASSGRVATKNVVSINRLDYFKPIDASFPESDFKYGPKAMMGFCRLSLVSPESAFGHAEYGQLLSKIMTANARRKKHEPLPNQPYTPMLNGITLDYKASSKITPAMQSDEQNSLSESIIHMHPFGVETVFPAELNRPSFLMPQYTHEGNLFIGLSGTDVSGPLNLLFHLSQDMTAATLAQSVEFDWFYLASNRWIKMSAKHLLSDTTHGFLESGIVSLNIPSDISRDNTVMPGNYFWLRVSTNAAAGLFSPCYNIKPHALKVSKKMDAGIVPEQKLAQAARWTPVHALPGIGKIEPFYKSFGGRAEESEKARNIRTSERLRHKNRALLPKDYEQLILEQFPDIYKVKCFNSISSKDATIKPGNVLIVVVPHIETVSSNNCAKLIINAKQLKQIRDYVQALCSEFIHIEVRNPAYEEIQVRCSVKFVDAISEGVNIKRLNQQISDYICPWSSAGYKARFGWSVQQQDIESYIRSLSYIEYVTNFSLLHISVDINGNYHLFDTAKVEQNNDAVISPYYPWSLVLPSENHAVESISSARPIKAEITGVDELAVGSNFIISGNGVNG